MGTAASNALKGEVEIHSRREIRMAEIAGNLTLIQDIIFQLALLIWKGFASFGQKEKSLHKRIVLGL